MQSRTHKWRQLKQSPSIISIISRRIWTIGQGLLDLVSPMTMVGLFLLPFSHALHRCWGGRDDFNTTSRNRVDHGKRNSISNKTIYYFLYYINTIVLYLQEKSTLLMKEKNGIHPRKILELPFSIRLGKKKCVESLQRQTIGKIFSYWLFPTKRSTCCKSSSCQFSFLAVRNAIKKAIKHVTFVFSFRILVFFRF